MKDKRKLKRQRPTVHIAVYDRATQQSVGRLVDLTTQGLRVIGKTYMMACNFYHLRLELPQEFAGSRHVSFEARCVWCNPDADAQECDSGFILEGLSSADIERLQLLLQGPFFRVSKYLQAFDLPLVIVPLLC